jgi:uncharacterized membrane-anchored protein YhcB (DUF1043 family)
MMIYTTLLIQAGRYTPPTGPVFWRVFILWLPAIFGIAFYILIAFCIYRAAKYFSSATREQKLLRTEMGKLAEEVHLMRQELKDSKDSDSSEL